MDEIRLLNYLKGELSEEEILQVEAWYEASPDNKKMLEQLYYTMFIGERAAVMESSSVSAFFVFKFFFLIRISQIAAIPRARMVSPKNAAVSLVR